MLLLGAQAVSPRWVYRCDSRWGLSRTKVESIVRTHVPVFGLVPILICMIHIVHAHVIYVTTCNLHVHVEVKVKSEVHVTICDQRVRV